MNDPACVPFLDLVKPHLELQDELIDVFRGALHTGRFIGGPVVESFEAEFADYCQAGYCVGAGSGTDALRFALIAAGVKRGDTVITVANTFIATTEAITQSGASPAFVDIDAKTYNMDKEKLVEFIETKCEIDLKTGRPLIRDTKSPVTAVVPVHLYGQMADMDVILEVAARYNLLVIEDACQAHGAGYFSIKENMWKLAGSMGVAAAFSFYPGKNLGACGEAGAVITNDGELAEKAARLRDHGQTKKYYHDIEGYNGRLDAIQAGILSVKLRRLNAWNEERRKRAAIYNGYLKDAPGITIPYEPSWSRAVYHLYVIRVAGRCALQRRLAENGFVTGLHYPLPLHLQKAYAESGYKEGDLPETEKAAKEILSLPIYPGLSGEGQKDISRLIIDPAARPW